MGSLSTSKMLRSSSNPARRYGDAPSAKRWAKALEVLLDGMTVDHLRGDVEEEECISRRGRLSDPEMPGDENSRPRGEGEE